MVGKRWRLGCWNRGVHTRGGMRLLELMEGGHGVNLAGREAQVYNSELIHPFFVFCLM